MAEDFLSRVELAEKAFSLRKAKRETLAYAFQQIKPVLEEYMKENCVLELEVNLEDGDFETVEAISHGEREMWVSMWLKGELSTKQLLKAIRDFRKFHVQRVSHGYGFDGFLREVESWLKEKRGSQKGRGVQRG